MTKSSIEKPLRIQNEENFKIHKKTKKVPRNFPAEKCMTQKQRLSILSLFILAAQI